MSGGPQHKSRQRGRKLPRKLDVHPTGRCVLASQKIKYVKGDAVQIAKRERRKGDRSFTEYHCNACHSWHVGHVPKGMNPGGTNGRTTAHRRDRGLDPD